MELELGERILLEINEQDKKKKGNRMKKEADAINDDKIDDDKMTRN